MPSDLENRTMELLTTVVEDEQKSITYRWLSRSMGVSVNIAKQFMETYLATVGKGKACGTYYVARQDAGTGNRAISLVTQEELDAIKNDEAVIGHHIYSVQPSPLKDLAILSVSNFEASQLQQGKDLNTYRIIHNPHVVVSKSNARPGVAAPSTSTSIAAKTAAAATPGFSGTKPGLTSTSSLSATSLAPKSTTTTTTTPANGTDSSTTHSKTKPASGSKPSMMSFFGKAATTVASGTTAAPKKTPTVSAATSSTTPSKKPSSTLNFKPAAPPQKRKADSMLATPSNPTTASGAADPPQESEEDEEEVDSEEERDRRLALSSRLDQDQGDVVVVNGAGNRPAQSTKKEALNVDADAIKKRQRSARRLAIDDDDDDDDDDHENENLDLDHGFARSKKSAPVDMEEDDEESVEVMTKEARAALNMEKEAQRLALENMMLMDDTTADLDKDEDSPMIDVEALDPKEDSSALASIPSSTTETVTRDGVVVRRRRGVRAVTKRKTSRNERGYMVTEDIVVMEPFSEDEIIQAPTPASAPAPVRAAKPAEPTKGKTEAAPKKKAGSGNQSLLNFFSKK